MLGVSANSLIPAAAMFGLMPRSDKNITPGEVLPETSPEVIFFGRPCFASTPSSRSRCVTSPTLSRPTGQMESLPAIAPARTTP